MGWTYGLIWGRQGIQSLTLLVLATIVGPAEFGYMALALVYVGFIEMILQQGFVAAIVQRPTLRQSHASSVFWLTLAASVLLAAVSVALRRYWSAATDSPSLAAVILVLSISIPLTALRMVPTALLTRHFQMKALTIRSLGAATVSAGIAIPAAFAGFGVWTLVAQHVSYAAASTVLVWKAARWRPRMQFHWADVRTLLPFSLGNFGARLGNFVAGQVDVVIIGVFWGAVPIGLYRMAARCVTIVLEFLSGPLQYVSFPDFSKMQANRDRFRQTLLAYLRFACLLTWPSLAMLAVLAPYIPRVIGPQWSGVEYGLAALAICGAVETTTQFLAPFLQSMGKAPSLAVIVFIQGSIGAALFAMVGHLSSGSNVAMQTASIGLAKAVLLLLVPLPALIMASRSLLALSARHLGAALGPGGLCAGMVLAIGLAVREGGRLFGPNELTRLAVLLVTMGVVWTLGVLALSPEARRLIAEAIQRLRKVPGGLPCPPESAE